MPARGGVHHGGVGVFRGETTVLQIVPGLDLRLVRLILNKSQNILHCFLDLLLVSISELVLQL